MNFTGSNILSVNQFNRDSIDYIFSVADKMQPYARRKTRTRVLDGAILGNLFFEPSTRTRVSFGTAFNLLGAKSVKLPAWKARPLQRANRFTTPLAY